jgi:hypothetical protein
MPKRACWWITSVALVVGVLFLTDRLLWEPGLIEDNVRRLLPGMTQAEVEALLGGPAIWEIDMWEGQVGAELGYRWLRHRPPGHS